MPDHEPDLDDDESGPPWDCDRGYALDDTEEESED
jgi:hypothetical protein